MYRRVTREGITRQEDCRHRISLSLLLVHLKRLVIQEGMVIWLLLTFLV